jgi:hypothetical protein
MIHVLAVNHAAAAAACCVGGTNQTMDGEMGSIIIHIWLPGSSSSHTKENEAPLLAVTSLGDMSHNIPQKMAPFSMTNHSRSKVSITCSLQLLLGFTFTDKIRTTFKEAACGGLLEIIITIE